MFSFDWTYLPDHLNRRCISCLNEIINTASRSMWTLIFYCDGKNPLKHAYNPSQSDWNPIIIGKQLHMQNVTTALDDLIALFCIFLHLFLCWYLCAYFLVWYQYVRIKWWSELICNRICFKNLTYRSTYIKIFPYFIASFFAQYIQRYGSGMRQIYDWILCIIQTMVSGGPVCKMSHLLLLGQGFQSLYHLFRKSVMSKRNP